MQDEMPEGNGQELKDTEPEGNGRLKLRSYKVVCAKLGLSMCVYFICRIASAFVTRYVNSAVHDALGHTAAVALSNTVAVILIYLIPMLFAAILFNSFKNYSGGRFKALYERPRRLARALGTFPAMYGLGYGLALLTFLVSFLITFLTDGQIHLEDILQPTAIDPSTDIASALGMVFLLVVIAPLFEEIWVRGIMYDALKPYGVGIAIIISSLLFGMMHGSLYMLFYTTALGFALGYVRYATGSIFIPTIIHAIINSVAAGLLFISALTEITHGDNRMLNTIFNVYILAVLVLIVVGLVSFFKRIPTIRKYRFENAWSEISGGKKTALFFISIPVIIMLVLAINEHLNGYLLGLLPIFRGGSNA